MRYLLAILFVASSWMDFLTTYALMESHPGLIYEANPLAAWMIHHHGWCGLGWAVIGMDIFVVSILLYAWRCKQRSAAYGFGVVCLVSNAVVVHNCVLLCQLVSSP